MTSWEAAGIFAAIVVFGISVGAPLLRLNSTITRLSTVLEIFQKQTNEKERLALWSECEEQGKKLGEHDTEIAVLKEKVG